MAAVQRELKGTTELIRQEIWGIAMHHIMAIPKLLPVSPLSLSTHFIKQRTHNLPNMDNTTDYVSQKRKLGKKAWIIVFLRGLAHLAQPHYAAHTNRK